MRKENLPHDIFTPFAHYFQLNLDETSLLFNEGKIKFLGSKDKPLHKKGYIKSIFSITVLLVGSESGVNGPVVFIAKGLKVKPTNIGSNLVTRCGLPERSCVIPNKVA